MSASGGASEAVLEAFKRFDADGSGSVSREELSSILKTLDDTFDDEAIDGLLVLADASGDGELQIEEFLRWIFVEDQGSMETMCNKWVKSTTRGLCTIAPATRCSCSTAKSGPSGPSTSAKVPAPIVEFGPKGRLIDRVKV